ncbi:MAG TPA: GAF domain-containing protein [Dehalococcoidia bacterium]|nr:GAF domain-containing protein [Dehalococcoidia bacterium]
MSSEHVTVAASGAAAAPSPSLSRPDGEFEALLRLAELHRRFASPQKPDIALQAICDLARDLTRGRYAALAITDERDRTEGFYTSGLTRAEMKGLKVPPTGHGPLGSLRSDGRPVRINDLENHPYAFGFPPRHPVMQRMLGVPIWAKGEVRGSMYITDRTDGEPFDDDDERAMVALARHATYIVENFWY